MPASFESHIADLMPHAEVILPPGEGPFPVLLQFHGCGGKLASQTTWARVANERGWAAVIVDSYAHRGISRTQAITSVCWGLKLWGRERAGDLYAALAWTKTQPWADGSRIVAAGWSHGGWTVLDALAMSRDEAEAATKLTGLPEAPLDGLVGAFLLYPYVGPGSVARKQGIAHDVGPLAVVGSRDSVVGGRSLRKTLEAVATPGAPIRIVWLEGATHAFDEPDAVDPRTRYDAMLTTTAQGVLADYLAEVEARAAIRVEEVVEATRP